MILADVRMHLQFVDLRVGLRMSKNLDYSLFMLIL